MTWTEHGGNPCWDRLQFGHGTDAVDDGGAGQWLKGQTQLQFGHGTDAVDDAQTRSSVQSSSGLQFGHGTDAVDDDGLGQDRAAPEGASIRPRH